MKRTFSDALEGTGAPDAKRLRTEAAEANGGAERTTGGTLLAPGLEQPPAVPSAGSSGSPAATDVEPVLARRRRTASSRYSPEDFSSMEFDEDDDDKEATVPRRANKKARKPRPAADGLKPRKASSPKKAKAKKATGKAKAKKGKDNKITPPAEPELSASPPPEVVCRRGSGRRKQRAPRRAPFE